MNELAEYSTLSSEDKAALTEEQYNAIKQVVGLDSEGNPQLKQPINFREIS